MHITITALGSRGDVQPCQATTLGENIRAEDEVANVVEIINRFFWGW